MSSVTRWRKRPVEITAVQYTGDNQGDVRRFGGYLPGADLLERHYAVRFGPDGAGEVYDRIHDSWIRFGPGHWIIRGIRGELYPCEGSVFAETYEPAAEVPGGR